MNRLSIFCMFFLCWTVSAQTQHRQFDSIARLVDEKSCYYNTETGLLVSQLYKIAGDSPDSLRLTAHCLCKEAKWYADQDELDTTLIDRIENQIKRLEGSGFLKEKAMLQYALGLCQSCLGEHGNTFTIALQALQQFKDLNDSLYVSRVLQLLAYTYFEIRLPKLSRDFFLKAETWMSNKDDEYYRILYNRYMSYAPEGDIENLIDSMQNLIAVPGLKKGQLVAAYLTLATAYSKSRMFSEADDYFDKTYQMIGSIDNPDLEARFYNSLGIHMRRQGNNKKSLELLTLSRILYEQDANPARLYSAYTWLSDVFESLGEKDSAVFYLKQKDEVMKKILANSRAVEVYQQYFRAYTQSVEDALTIAKQQVELEQRQQIIIAVTLVFMILIALLSFLFMRQKRLRKEAENKMLTKQLEQEKEIQSLKEKEYQLKQQQQQDLIAVKERELTSYSMLLSNKNAFLKHILKLNAKARKNGDEIEGLTNQVDAIINENFNVEKEWVNFRMHFEKINPDFMKTLKNRYKNLTEENLRVCAYIRVGMTNREISQSLNVLPRTINTIRYRLKSKFGLSEENNLDVFLKNV